jgi:hypothetical protein
MRSCGCEMEFWVQDLWNEIEGEAEHGLKKVCTHDLKLLALYDYVYKNRQKFDERRTQKYLRSA